MKDLFVKGELMVVQIDGGENPIFVEEIITQGDLVEQIELGDLLLLLETIEEKKELGLKGVFLAILIKLGEERVVVCLLQNTSGIELLCQKFHQACFSDADGAFDDDISEHDALNS
jgi:hypothetical protein